MCRRYLLTASLQSIESRFALPPQSINLEPNYNITPGQYVPVIANNKPYEIQHFKFGFTPFWARSEMKLINARAEGDSNKEDSPTFRGSAGIILKKAFRKPIRSQRCIVIVSAFIEFPGSAGISNPHLVYLRNHQNPFAIAGIWDTWLNPLTGFHENTFCIITTSANSLLRQIGGHRMPVILSDYESKKWINSATELSVITGFLNQYDSKLMNAYPISPAINNQKENNRQLIQPTGPKVLPEEQTHAIRFPYTSGYHTAKKARKANTGSTMADMIGSTRIKENES